MSVIIFTEPNYPTEYDRTKDELFRMECNCRRMKWMIQNGYCVDEYTDEHWKRFKELKQKKMSKEMDINKELEETLTKALHEERMKAYQPVRDLLDKYNISPDDRVKLMIDSQSQAEKEVGGIPELDRVIEITIENINKQR